jgi:hypothetical protein
MKKYWLTLSKSTRAHIISAVRVFLATFGALSIPTLLAAGVENWNYALLTSVGVSALNGALKVVWETFFPKK